MKDQQRALKAARELYFTTGEVSPSIRPEIAVSWRRSALAGLNPESLPQSRFAEPRLNQSLQRAAAPVVERLLQDIGEDRAAMLLLDPDGIVVARWSASRSINTILDRSEIGKGRIFDEAAAGTTGLGTPLENRKPVVVEGAEHVLTSLDGLTAVGTPIIHPTRGSVAGIIDLVGTVGVDAALMMALIARAAADIADRLVAGYAAEDRALMDAFLRVDRRGPKRAILAVNDRLIIGNGPGNELALSGQHSELWARSRKALEHDVSAIPVTKGDESLEGRISPVGDDDLIGAIIQLERPTGTHPSQKPTAATFTNAASPFADAERETIRSALETSGGNRQEAARVLGVSRATLYRKMARLGIVG